MSVSDSISFIGQQKSDQCNSSEQQVTIEEDRLDRVKSQLSESSAFMQQGTYPVGNQSRLHSTIDISVADLLDRGWAQIGLNEQEHDQLKLVFSAAETFFEAPEAAKAKFSLHGELEGFRRLGAEFSQTPERPDLNEAFGLVARNLSRTANMGWPDANPLHVVLRTALAILTPKVDSFFEELRRKLAPNGDRLVASDWSYLQVNHYWPSHEARTLLQDEHEDGHLVTVLMADQPGLEIEVDGVFRPAPSEAGFLLVMPGSILTLVTGGRIAPLRHRVRRDGRLMRRTSMMFFVNPSLDHSPCAWLPDAQGKYPSIREAAIEMSTAFGLPALDHAVPTKGDIL